MNHGSDQSKAIDSPRARGAALLRRGVTRLLVGVSELFLAVGLAVVFFLVLMGILNASFPRGTGLKQLVQARLEELSGGASRLDLGAGAEDRDVIARLVQVQRRVKDRPADAIAWRRAAEGLSIGDRHTIQTLARSAAEISFDERDRLWLDEKSLVVIKRSDSGDRRARRHASLVLLGGQMRGTLARTEDGAPALQVLAAGAEALIQPASHGPAEYTIRVNEDDSTTFSMLEGRAEISAGGSSVVVEAHHTVTVIADEAPGVPRPLVEPPVLLEPDDAQSIVYGAVSPRVNFRWSSLVGADGYRFMLARDPGFSDLVHEAILSSDSFVHGNLQPGHYYWRVHGMVGTAEGAPSAIARLTLSRDAEPPPLHVELPEQLVLSSILTVRGSTEPGADVIIGDRVVPTEPNGEFEHELSLRLGPNLIVVQAIDASGNVNYDSRYVNAKF